MFEVEKKGYIYNENGNRKPLTAGRRDEHEVYNYRKKNDSYR